MEDRIIRVEKDGQQIDVYINPLTLADREKAESYKIKKWNQAVKSGAIFSESLNKVLEEQGIWNKEKDDKIAELRMEIADALDTIDKGGIKLSEARELALKVRRLRNEISAISFARLKYVNETVEGQAQNAEFNYLVSQIAVYNDNRSKRYFLDYEDYLNRANDFDAYLISAKCADVLYGNNEGNWAENRFLKDRGFIDEKLRLINADGHLVDLDGRLIDEYGNLIKYDEAGKKIFIDENGDLLETKVERKPFLDDYGNPILDKEAKSIE